MMFNFFIRLTYYFLIHLLYFALFNMISHQHSRCYFLLIKSFDSIYLFDRSLFLSFNFYISIFFFSLDRPYFHLLIEYLKLEYYYYYFTTIYNFCLLTIYFYYIFYCSWNFYDFKDIINFINGLYEINLNHFIIQNLIILKSKHYFVIININEYLHVSI